MVSPTPQLELYQNLIKNYSIINRQLMIQFSSETIEYQAEQIIQTLTISNPSNVQILFKVKTNNIKFIDARPNVGSIPSGKTSQIKIKRNETIGDGVKLQIIYLSCPDVLDKDNFKELWGKYQKSQQSKTFQVRALNKGQQKKVQDPEIKKKPQQFTSVISNAESDPSLFQSVRVSRKNVEQPEAAKNLAKLAVDQEKPKQNEKLKTFQKLTEQQKENKQLEQKLAQKQSQIKGLPEPMELQVDKFLASPACKKQHLPFSILIVIALIFFVLGYYFGSSTETSQA